MSGSRLSGWAGAALLLVLAAGAAGAAGAQPAPFSIAVAPASAEWRPLVRLDGILLEDRALREALGSGLPLRFRFRIELWEKAFFDRLVGSDEVSLAVVQDPLDRTYTLTTGHSNQRFGSLADAERGVARYLPTALRPGRRDGQFYYLGSLEIETLSLSDLEELQRWLRGEARPAVEGRTPVGRALGRGVQRAFVRMIGLPTRRYEARSPTFSPV